MISHNRHDDPVRAVAVLPDGHVATGGDDGRVLLWDPDRPGEVLAEALTPVSALSTGHPTTRLVIGSADQGASVWDAPA